MTRSVPAGEVRLLGDRAFLIGAADEAAARLLVQALSLALLEPLEEDDCEVVGGLASAVVRARDVHVAETLASVVRAVAAEPLKASNMAEEAGAHVVIPCVFDGPDLGEVAQAAGCSPDEVVARLTAQPLRVAMLGFSPGFAFLSDLPESLRAVPRRAQPRTAVPAGSVARANGYAAVYPSASPGGWHLVGRTDLAMFTPAEPPYARLRAGDTVQFAVTSSAGEGERRDVDERGTASPSWPLPVWQPTAKSRHLFTVVTPGLRTVRQDGGRRGGAAIGVPAGGPADPHAFTLANRLVGNDASRAALEIIGQGPTLRAEGSGYVTVVGASPRVRLDGQVIAAGRVFPVRPGQELVVGAVRPGLRTYLAAAGGFGGPTFLGSVATDQLSGLGPGPLAAGDALYVESMIPPLADHLDHLEDGLGDTVVLRVVPGPHPEWFSAGALDRLADTAWVVAAESNRVGLRLRRVGEAGESASLPWRADDGGRELDSQGMVHGAVQVPPDGNPVVLLPDHATHGGYPVLAVVITADLGRLGQCAPGDTVRLEVVSVAEASEARTTQRRIFERAVVGYYPLAVE